MTLLHMSYFTVVGEFSEEVTQSVEAHSALSEGTAERSTPTRVSLSWILIKCFFVCGLKCKTGCDCKGECIFLTLQTQVFFLLCLWYLCFLLHLSLLF